MDEGVSWYSTGVDFASPQENIVAALALVYHATSTGGEELLKKHMAEIIAGSEDYTRDGSTSGTSDQSSDKIELMCAIASLKAKSTPPRCPPA